MALIRIPNRSAREPAWASQRQWPRTHVPRAALRWLLDPASLTRRVERACGEGFRIELLHQAWTRPLPSEAQLLRLRAGGYALCREVHLRCRSRPWVFARTVIPPRTVGGPGRRLAHLGERSLGALLFADVTLERGEVAIARLRPGEWLYERATAALGPPPAEVWGRRSVFRLKRRPLLVTEVFLPDILGRGFSPGTR
ncbi:MAG: chorismate lyase [Gammaproteobacteria bacterium]|nr:chorismate lyase [Gammaproteobacteria bacterium]